MGIIAVVALLIFGPEKLPEMMGQAGKLVRDFRSMTAEMSGEFEKTIAEAKSVTKDIQGEVGSMTKQVSSVSKSVQNDLSGKKSTTTKKVTTASKRSSSSSTSKKGTTSPSTTKRASTSKTSSTSSSTTSSSSGAPSTSSTSATAKKAAAPVTASREDPTASISLFEPSAPRRERRTRKATLASFGEATPRTSDAVETVALVERSDETVLKTIDLNDPLARARQRRLSAGYARRTP